MAHTGWHTLFQCVTSLDDSCTNYCSKDTTTQEKSDPLGKASIYFGLEDLLNIASNSSRVCLFSKLTDALTGIYQTQDCLAIKCSVIRKKPSGKPKWNKY